MTSAQPTITSNQNPKFKLWKSLLLTKNRKKEGLFLLSGQKIIADFLRDTASSHYAVAAILAAKPMNSKLTTIGIETDSVFTLDTLLFKELDVLGTDFPLLVCQRPADVIIPELPPPVGLELGLPLTDPSNLGALCRTALSFGVTHIILTPGACDPFHPKALRASSGATLKMKFFVHTPNQSNKYIVTDTTAAKDKDTESASNRSDVCLDLTGQSLFDFNWPKNIRLWLGEEGQGFSRVFKPQSKITIPIKSMESLNAAVAGSIAIFSYSQRFNKL